ncbi:TIGR00159 family protein [candidate division KSB1 bacterium 4484_188]|nr:MAG: TIGR00159 family protein [candidate division KSB1 bacterium 4484_188]HFE65122.1 TIGR00159 family protein [Caldithrix sp.]
MLFRIGFLSVSIIDVFDVFLVAYIFYKVYEFLKGSMAARMMMGLLIIILFSIFAEILNMSGSSWIFSNLKTVWVIAFVIIFQPEFRRLLLYLGQNPVLRRFVQVSTTRFIDETIGAVSDLSRKNFGALIVLLRDTGIKHIVETGISLQAQVSKALILSIFNPRSPLHDGAIVIQNDIIVAAKCQLPLTENPKLDPSLGMRHRAALGLSEQADVTVLVVSEETGMISLAEQGILTRGLTEEGLRKRLLEAFSPDKPQKRNLADILKWGEEV